MPTVTVDASENIVDCSRVELEIILGDEMLAHLSADGRIKPMAHGDKLRFDEPLRAASFTQSMSAGASS